MNELHPPQVTLRRLATLMALTALAACGGGGSDVPSSGGPAAPATGPVVSPPPAAPISPPTAPAPTPPAPIPPAPTPPAPTPPAPAPAPVPAPPPASGELALACFDLDAPQGKRAVVQYRYSGATSIDSSTSTISVGAAVVFEGYQAVEMMEAVRVIVGGNPIDVVTRDYRRLTGPMEVTHFGIDLDAGATVNGVAHTLKLHTVFEPPLVDRLYALRAGESTRQTTTGRVTSTDDGVVGTPTIINSTTTTRFVGIERLVVPAGTFAACLFEETTDGQAGSVRRWLQIGQGIVLKQVTNNGTASEIKEAASLTGQPKR
jgi:hypothetical protein